MTASKPFSFTDLCWLTHLSQQQPSHSQTKRPNTWQDPAKTSSLKIRTSCHTNGQGPPLSLFRNNYIINAFNPKRLERAPKHAVGTKSKLHTRLLSTRPNADLSARPRGSRTTHEASFERRSAGKVWGVDIDDHPFSFDCLLDNMSASGLYLRLPRQLKFSSVVSLVVRLLHGAIEEKSAAIKGTVIREEVSPDGRRGIGIRIIEHRFI